MTSFSIQGPQDFTAEGIGDYEGRGGRYTNWPIVYTLNNERCVYVGETIHGVERMRQHRMNAERSELEQMRFIIDETFNKSAALDLECQLIKLFHADQNFTVLNKVEGIRDSDYYGREDYREGFQQVFQELLDSGLLTRPIPELVNSDLYKLSPFKSLEAFQAEAVDRMVPRLLEALTQEERTELVVKGEPGTGKTVVAIYLVKLLMDIRRHSPDDGIDEDLRFSELYTDRVRELLAEVRIGYVVPQQSLRKTVANVFRNTPGLEGVEVLDAFGVGKARGEFDLLVVDEVHRLGVRANQSSGMKNSQFREITERLFGEDDTSKTQLDWLRAKSRNLVLMVDPAQTVRPMDLSSSVMSQLIADAERTGSLFTLRSQLRLKAPDRYIGQVRQMLRGERPRDLDFGGYEIHLFDHLSEMVQAVKEREREHGLSRLVAGFAWPWISNPKRKNKTAGEQPYDIVEDGVKLRWNSTDQDWINSANSREEVGSIHTVQGYDLNYAGVIIGRDLRLDPQTGRVWFDAQNYHDKKGKERNNRLLGTTYTDADILEYIINIYAVLMSRGIRGTFLYVCDEPLREHLRSVLAGAGRGTEPRNLPDYADRAGEPPITEELPVPEGAAEESPQGRGADVLRGG